MNTGIFVECNCKVSISTEVVRKELCGYEIFSLPLEKKTSNSMDIFVEIIILIIVFLGTYLEKNCPCSKGHFLIFERSEPLPGWFGALMQ